MKPVSLLRLGILTILLPITTCKPLALSVRSDDPNQLQNVVMQQAETISQLQAKLASMETEITNLKTQVGTKVAFNARLTGPTDFTGESTIIFDAVDLNQGGGYDKLTGIFTAPVNGLYVFSLKIAHTPPGSIHVYVSEGNLSKASSESCFLKCAS
ncbi:hypothetical protein BaRGS_00002169 [Batillaria attramentaria]|uniref:C1q domain-containing protein n=1 Tax=Batillaria attramentaria TaxID=370345 RepID=A0ABD0M5M0_9CAEN